MRRDKHNLQGRWWHRFFIVLYATLMLFCTIATAAIISESGISKTTSNSNYTTLKDYTKNHPESRNATIPFLRLGGEVGCVNDGKISYISTYSYNTVLKKSFDSLAEATFCNANLKNNVENAISFYTNLSSSYDEIGARKVITDGVDDIDGNGDPRYCFVPKDLKCSSSDIVKYSPNTAFYLQTIALTLVIVYVIGLLLQFLYYFGFIYIVFGNT